MEGGRARERGKKGRRLKKRMEDDDGLGGYAKGRWSVKEGRKEGT
jgi:hypothetical protein